ncbi:MAG: hypothetical protein ACK5QW_04875 [Cyanobacteriota bacterium]
MGNHLAALQRKDVIDVYHDRHIGAGQAWPGAISTILEAPAPG